MNIDEQTIQESKKLIKALKDEEGMDFTKPTEEVETEILKLWDLYEREKRLRHTGEAWKFYGQLENAYVKQASIRGDQMKREEKIRIQIRILHEPFTGRWLKDLQHDVLDLWVKRSVYGIPDPQRNLDRETGETLILVTHNLKSVSNTIKKIQTSIVKIREAVGKDSLDNLEKIYLVGHETANSKLKEENFLATKESFNDLLSDAKQEMPKFTEMTLPELAIEASVNKTVSALEKIKRVFE